MGCCGQQKVVAPVDTLVSVRAVSGLAKSIRIMVEPGKVLTVNPGDTGIALTQSKAIAYRQYVEIES